MVVDTTIQPTKPYAMLTKRDAKAKRPPFFERKDKSAPTVEQALLSDEWKGGTRERWDVVMRAKETIFVFRSNAKSWARNLLASEEGLRADMESVLRVR